MGADLIWYSVKWKLAEAAAGRGSLHEEFFDEEAEEPGLAFEAEEIEPEHEALSWLGAWWPMMGLTEEFLQTALPRPAGFEEQAALLRELGIFWGTRWEERDVTAGPTGVRKDLPLPEEEEVETPMVAAYSPESLKALAKRVHDQDWSGLIGYLGEIRVEEDPTGESERRPSCEELEELLKEIPEFLEGLAEHGRGVLTVLSY